MSAVFLGLLRPLFRWVSGPLWRCVVRNFWKLVQFSARLPLPWRGAGKEPDRSARDPPGRCYSEDEEEDSVDEEPGSISVHVPERSDPDRDADGLRVDPTDEFYCDYDSTWETEPVRDGTGARRASRSVKFRRFENAARDMQNYRHNYPTLRRTRFRGNPVSEATPNLSFYLGHTLSIPDGVYIQEFHSDWFRDYSRLEHVHTFIQWLFPLREAGMNDQAIPLSEQEVQVMREARAVTEARAGSRGFKGFFSMQAFRENVTAKNNLVTSYKLLLDFYGIELCDTTGGEVQRAEHWRERFDNLNRHTHNNLRITRILKCLGTLGFPQYQAPLVRFFLTETLVHGELPNVRDSVLSYFLFAVLDKRQRRGLLRFAHAHFPPEEEFVWVPMKVQRAWSREELRKKRERLPHVEMV